MNKNSNLSKCSNVTKSYREKEIKNRNKERPEKERENNIQSEREMEEIRQNTYGMLLKCKVADGG